MHVVIFFLACGSFHLSYPSWEPSAQGKQFLSTLRLFKEQKLRYYSTRNSYSQSAMWRGNTTFREQRGDLFSSDGQRNPSVIGYDLGGLWPIDAYQERHPYILDWYYTSVPKHHAASSMREAPDVTIDVETHDDIWNLTQSTNQVLEHKNFWEHTFDDRAQSGMGASTSTPFLQESVLQRNDFNNTLPREGMKTQWWERTEKPRQDQPQSSFIEPPAYEYINQRQPQDSFLEPPQFNNVNRNYTSNSYLDNISEKSLEEQEQYLDWRNSSHHLARTTFIDDIEDDGGIQLHFDDVYSKSPFPTMNPDSRSNSDTSVTQESPVNKNQNLTGVWNENF